MKLLLKSQNFAYKQQSLKKKLKKIKNLYKYCNFKLSRGRGKLKKIEKFTKEVCVGMKEPLGPRGAAAHLRPNVVPPLVMLIPVHRHWSTHL